MMRNYLFILLSLTLLTACHHHNDDDDDKEDKPQAERTVIVYMSGENSLTDAVTQDLEEMKEGSRTIGNNNLVVYVDQSNQRELPWMGRISNGRIIDSLSIADMGISNSDVYSSDPQVMEKVLRYAVNRYPANQDYGLVLWGHSSGWLVQDSLPYTRAYGVDNGQNAYHSNGYWINIPTLKNVIESSLPHLQFIFADCCNFMCLETLYELRHTTNYIIGSPAEIPYDGAPYSTVIPALFEKTTFATSAFQKYIMAYSGCLPFTVVRTSEMENVAQATRAVLLTMKSGTDNYYPDMTGRIHYYYKGNTEIFHPENNIFYDAGDYIRTYAPAADYQQWKQALDAAIVEKAMADKWQTDKLWSKYYSDFNMTEAAYHGVSIFVPQDPNYGSNATYLRNIEKFEWYHVVGL